MYQSFNDSSNLVNKYKHRRSHSAKDVLKTMCASARDLYRIDEHRQSQSRSHTRSMGED